MKKRTGGLHNLHRGHRPILCTVYARLYWLITTCTTYTTHSESSAVTDSANQGQRCPTPKGRQTDSGPQIDAGRCDRCVGCAGLPIAFRVRYLGLHNLLASACAGR